MNTTLEHDAKFAAMSFATVYPLYINKLERKGRTKQELYECITWLTGFNNDDIQNLLDENVSFEIFFSKATLHPNAHLITGMICGYRIEDIENTVTRQVRYLDKLVDELAKGKKMEKVLRIS
jgi:hypothetical protein